MSATPWTPGPWRVGDDDWFADCPFIPIESADDVVCEVSPVCAIDDSLDLNATSRANARLIQHAPDMAEALERFCKPAEDGEPISLGDLVARAHRLFGEAHSLLSRIRGDAP